MIFQMGNQDRIEVMYKAPHENKEVIMMKANLVEAALLDMVMG